MLPTKGYAAQNATSPLAPFSFSRRALGAHDVLIKIAYCGVCHSDIHQARDEWGGARFPMVPGHEIVGHITHVGEQVTQYKVGDTVGVGCFVDSCRECANCHEHEEQFCPKRAMTYNGVEVDGKTPTFGGYSNQIVTHERYVLRIPPNLDLAKTAPLLCAGITTYSPLRRNKITAGKRVGIVGLGGLGHMGVKLAAAMGADVTVFSTSPNKAEDAKRLGAHQFVVTRDPRLLAPLAGKFDFILDAVSAEHDLNVYLNLLNRGGTMTIVGVPTKPAAISAFSLITNRRSLSGSLIGGIKETQEMLDFCGSKNITSDIELIAIDQINEAYDRTIKSDVKYRFVIDMATL